ncbi:hypothetical protein [Pseudomonas sp. CF161]|uniref:hypothetical protein n=1 Tax=Pseudomonas sp. CF161 TaxID=911241 RepID=UPI0012EB5146|nr:hypothetical protein [Pseudomonas sp. CF161]
MQKDALAFFFSMAVFLLSISLLPYYTSGDQLHYRAFYENLPDYGFIDGFHYYNEALGSKEIGYYVYVYLFSELLKKDFLISLTNAFLGYIFAKLLLEKNTSPVVLFLLFFNFYLLILLFSAERLKLSIIFCMLAFRSTGRKSFLFWLSAIFSHVQILMLLSAQTISKLSTDLSSLLRGHLKTSLLISLITVAVFSLTVFTLLGDHITTKLNAYTGTDRIFDGGFHALLKPIVFLILATYYSKNKILPLFIYLPLLIAAYFVGDERLVIFSYIFFMYYALQVNRGLNVGVLTTGVYFLAKGLLFIDRIIEYGDGFYGA